MLLRLVWLSDYGLEGKIKSQCLFVLLAHLLKIKSKFMWPNIKFGTKISLKFRNKKIYEQN